MTFSDFAHHHWRENRAWIRSWISADTSDFFLLTISGTRESPAFFASMWAFIVITKTADICMAFYSLQGKWTHIFSRVPRGEKKTHNLSELTIPILQIRKQSKKLTSACLCLDGLAVIIATLWRHWAAVKDLLSLPPGLTEAEQRLKIQTSASAGDIL